VLRPGTYYINPSMFSLQLDDVAVIERGQVGVIVSNVGEDPTDEMKKRIGSTQLGASERKARKNTSSRRDSAAFRKKWPARAGIT